MRYVAQLLGLTLLLALPLAAALGAGLRPTWATAHHEAADERGRAVAYDPSTGNFIVVGETSSEGRRDGVVAAFRALDGRVVWSDRVDLQGDNEVFTAVAVSQGRVFAGGEVRPEEGPAGALLRAYDAQGEAWTLPEAGVLPDVEERIVALAVTPDGASVMALLMVGVQPASDLALVAYEAATGAERWRAHYDGPAGGEDVPTSLALSADGTRAFVGGRTWRSDAEKQDALALAFDLADGSLRWERVLAGLGHGPDGLNALALAPDGGRLFGVGTVTHRVDLMDVLAVALDPTTGAVLWLTPQSTKMALDLASAIAVSPDGTTVVAAGEAWLGLRDGLTVAFDAETGTRRWTATYDGPAGVGDALYGAAVSDGEAVVGGVSVGADGSFDLVALGYDLVTGQQRWVGRHDTLGGQDAGYALAVGPGGRVAVAGEAGGYRRTHDLALAAFDPPRLQDPGGLR